MDSLKDLASVIKPPRIRRKHLRKYSWLPDVIRVEGSIISGIIGPVLTVTLFATGVAYASHEGYNVYLTNSVVPVVAVVVGLILVFRNGSSYDRYWEGRKDFQNLTSHVRNLSRQIWIHVSIPPPDAPMPSGRPKNTNSELTPFSLRRRKINVIKLCLAFVFATKHYLRGEDGLDYEDYDHVIPAAFARRGRLDLQSSVTSRRDSRINDETAPTSRRTSRSNSPDGRRQDSTNASKRVRVKRSNPTMRTPLLSNSRHMSIDFAEQMSSPLPLIIAHEITRAIFVFKRDGLLETVGPAGTNALSALVQGMVDSMSNMERIANTPIPKSYQIHLKQAVTLYLFALPFTLVKELGWGMIPIVTVVAFTFMGIEGIASEIEMPFGTDKSDLPLDLYCADLKEEIEYLIERLPEGGEGMYGFDDGLGDD